MLEKINAILYDWGPINLKQAQVPSDEYIEEARLLEKELKFSHGLCSLSVAVYNIFLTQFGESSFSCSVDDCLTVAQELLNILYLHSFSETHFKNIYWRKEDIFHCNVITTAVRDIRRFLPKGNRTMAVEDKSLPFFSA